MMNKILPLFMILMIGCYRGSPSEDPPIHLNPNMDNQPKYKAQAKSEFFEDRATMRMPVPGTVARGDLRADHVYFQGKNADGSLVVNSPVEVTLDLLKRGQERYNIYCAPCHDRTGAGQGIVIKKGFLPPPSLHLDRLREAPDGHFFDVISNGIRNMPPYNHQVQVADRWAIVAYIRALQRSQNARRSDVPEELINQIN
jgi:hypothetical protein